MWMGFAAQAAHVGQDSILLKIDKRNQTLIGAKTDKSTPLKDELTQVFEKKGLVLTDSLWQNIRKTIQSNTDLDSSIRVKIGNSQVKITVIRSDRDLLGQQASVTRNKPLDRIVEIGTNNKEVVDIGLKGIHVKESNGEEVHIGWNGVHVKESNGGETRLFWGGDSLKTKQKKEKENFFDRDGMSLYLGLNGLSGKVPSVTTMIYPPNYLQTDTDLKPISSRYFSIEISESLTITKSKKSAFRLGLGISFDWYNFMFDHNRMVQKANQGAIFQPIFDTQGKDISFSKNKLTVSYINIPVMPHVVFNKNSGVQMIGLGGYVGYRIDSWTKSIEEKSENLNRVSSNFNLNQFRYGLRAEFAFKKLPNLFFNYDLSPLFEKNSSPNLTGFSFGIRL
jgi:hypothetical protein